MLYRTGNSAPCSVMVYMGKESRKGCIYVYQLIPKWFSGKESTCQEGDAGLIPGSGRSLEKEIVTHSSILAWEIRWTG